MGTNSGWNILALSLKLLIAIFFYTQGSQGFQGFPGANGEKGTRVCQIDFLLFLYWINTGVALGKRLSPCS